MGRSTHQDPGVPNEGWPGRGMPLRHGMALAIEPLVIADGRDGTYTAGGGRPCGRQPRLPRRAHGRDHGRWSPDPHGAVTVPDARGPRPTGPAGRQPPPVNRRASSSPSFSAAARLSIGDTFESLKTM
ncbi:hypothetical protein [Streptomyces pristinaespiralis]